LIQLRSTAAGVTLAAALVSSILVSACGGSSPASPSPTPQPAPQPTPTPAPTPAPTSTERWAISGQVVATGSRRPIGGARVTSDVGPTTQADAAGAFRLGSDINPAFTPHAFTVDADGYLSRKAYVRWESGLRSGITFDLIPLAAPFSIDFYRALVRNGYEAPSQLEPLRRWTTNPSFYVRSADQNGKPIEPEVMAVVLDAIPEAVRQFTGGVLRVAQLESGPETRQPAQGWITVNIIRDMSLPYCGEAFVARDPGEITLVNDRCNCGSVKISGGLVAHEVGHALGFWHVANDRNVMYNTHPSGCPAVNLSADERFHAGLAYQRPPGNRDPDADPASAGAAQVTPRTLGADGPAVVCGLR
jgi:hypothetical protein